MSLERWLYIVPLRLRSLFRRGRLDRELHEELQYHLDAKTQLYVASGLAREEAHRNARRELGAEIRVREQCQDSRGVHSIETLIQDLRYGLRTLRKNPGYTAVAVITLALGIGANTAMFSLVDGILLVPLPYHEPGRLVSITGTYPKGAFVAMRERVQTIDVAAYSVDHEVNLTGAGEPVRLTSALVSAELFSILGALPEIGQAFAPGQDHVGQDASVILSHAIWERRFASDRTIVGRSIELEGVNRQVLGVMPADFRFPSAKTDVWIPLHSDPGNAVTYWAGDFMPVIGRLRSGSTLEQARADVRVFQSGISNMFPWPMPPAWNRDVSVVPLQNGMVADVRGRLLILFGSVVLVLLIACANVANLTLARAASREKEIVIRAALGAGRRRIARQLLTESVLLASLGGLFGLMLATGGLSMMKAVLPADMPRVADTHIDWRVLWFTGGLAILTGFIFGLAPALQVSRGTLTDALKSGGRDGSVPVSHRLRGSLVVAEIACAVLLVISAGLLMRSLWALSRVDPGFQSEHVLTARITPNESFCTDAGRCITFYRSLIEQVAAAPGVGGAAVVNTPPLGGRVSKRSLDLEGLVVRPGETSTLFWLNIVTPEYFRVMGMHLLAGAGFSEADWSGSPAPAIVTASTARRFWPEQDAVGKHVRFVGEKDWRTVVGVIADVRAYDLQQNVPQWIAGTVYVPYSVRATVEDRRVPADMTIAIRTTSTESQVDSMLRRVVTGLSRDVPVSGLQPMRAAVSNAMATPATTTALLAGFAGLALLLGLVGIYGVLSFLVSKRTREIGLRIALGARRHEVLWLVLRQGITFAGAGIALGSVGAFAATRLLSKELYGISPVDPATYLAVGATMLAVTLLACAVPTRRAMRVDPLVALREE
jgi:putative ABC transport system permease protein